MAIKDYNGSDPTSKLLATTSNNGFMSSSDKKIVNSTSNPNLLTNPNFAIWQRGTSFTTTSQFEYTADRWGIYSNSTSGGIVVSKDNNGLKITYKSSYVTQINCIQYIERVLDNSKYYTISYSINGTVSSATFKGGNYKDSRINVVVYESSTGVGFYLNTNDILNWAKLEEGSIATTFIAPDFPLELLKCERFYQYIEAPVYYTGITYYISGFLYRTQMRVAPSVSFYDVSDSNDKLSGTFTAIIPTVQSIQFIAYNGGSATSVGSRNIVFRVELDAEIY